MGAENGKPVDACPNCGKPGKHFVPPSIGDQGFYVCDEKQELIEVPVKFLDKTSSTVEALCARIAEIEAERNLISDSETKLAKECVEKQSRIDEIETENRKKDEGLVQLRLTANELLEENKRLRECIGAFLSEAAPWLDISGAMYNRDLADCADRRLRSAVGE